VYYDIRTSQHPYLESLRDFWKNVYEEVVDHHAGPRPYAIAILGMSPDPRGEPERLFQALGVEVAASVFPRLSLEGLRRIREAALVVSNNWEYVRIIFQDMLSLLDRPTLRLPLPYGIQGSAAWYHAVAEALDRHGERVDGLDEVQQAREQFEEHRAHIQGRRIGLIARYRGAENRLSPRLRFGVPLLPFLRELGLAVDLRLFVDAEDDPDAASTAGALGLDAAGADTVAFFHHWRELPGMLSRSRCDLVYTETFRDERVTSAGKVPLHLHQLLPGFHGAVRTARTVRGLLTSGFYGRYSRFMKAPFAHFRGVD
jgi:hypothetical protein